MIDFPSAMKFPHLDDFFKIFKSGEITSKKYHFQTFTQINDHFNCPPPQHGDDPLPQTLF